MQDIIERDFEIKISGEVRGKLSHRVFHLLSSSEGKNYICNPNSEELYEISWVEEIKSIQESNLKRVNIHYKTEGRRGVKAITLKKNTASTDAIKRIITRIKAI